jgi:4'-phosphopantetheinyl transferase
VKRLRFAPPKLKVRFGMTTFSEWPALGPDDDAVTLPTERVDCLAFSLTAPSPDAQGHFQSFLSTREIEIARRYRHKHDRADYVTRHAALRLILARYLNTSPASLMFDEEMNGRPILASPAARLYFNLSSSGDISLLAVSCVAPVGVDVEKVREIADLLTLARDHFAQTEFDDLNRLASEEKLFSFFMTWTRKEAFVKATGLGLSFPLDGFSTGRTDSPAAVDVGGARDTDWTMKDLVPGPGYAGALAIHQPRVAIRCRRADWSWLLDPPNGRPYRQT